MPTNDFGAAPMLNNPDEMTKVDRLKADKQYYLNKIEMIERAIELLTKNPEFAELNDLLRKL